MIPDGAINSLITNQLMLLASVAVNFAGDTDLGLFAAIEQLIIAYIKTVKHTRQSTKYLFFMDQNLFINKNNNHVVTLYRSNHITKHYICIVANLRMSNFFGRGLAFKNK